MPPTSTSMREDAVPSPPATSADAIRPVLPLAVLLCGTLLMVLDGFIVNVALPSIQRDLGAGDADVEWIVAGYSLTFGGLLMASGPISRRWGRRRTFLSGVFVFVLASAVCGCAPGVGVLIGARLLQGTGAALVSPMVLALIGDIYAGAARLRAMGLYATVLGLGAALGQLIGGSLIHADIAGLGWRSIFLVNLPVGLAVLVLGPRVLPAPQRLEGERGGSRFDALGLLLVIAASVTVLLPLLEGRRLGWPAWTWITLAAGLLCAAAFAVHVRRVVGRGGAPLIDPAAFVSRSIRIGLICQALLYATMASYFVVLAIYLQAGRGLGPLASGLIFTVMVLTYIVGTRSAARLIVRFGRPVIPVAALVLAGGHLLLFAAVGHIGVDGSVLWLAPGLAVAGLGMGVCLSSVVTTVMAGVEPANAAMVSTVLTTVQQLANALGVALVGLVFYGAQRHGLDVSLSRSLLCLAGTNVLLAVPSSWLGRPIGTRRAS